MQINLIYPKIPENSDKFHGKCIAFEKYDGTNLHWKWDPQEGWTHFGTRRTQFTLDERGILGFQFNHMEVRSAPRIFNDILRDKLTMFLCKHSVYSVSNVIVFTEFYGPNSFAGNHEITDEHQLILIDVMVLPKSLLKIFLNLDRLKSFIPESILDNLPRMFVKANTTSTKVWSLKA